jgi:hypothetical protein
MARLTGNLASTAGVATCGAAVAIFPTSVCATQSTSVCSATATTTTNSSGIWDELALAANTYDVRITCGSSVRWRRYNDEVQHATFQTGDACASGTEGNFYWGDANDVGMRWSTADSSNHAFVTGLGATNAAWHIANMGDIATDWAVGAEADPQVFIHSNTSPASDYLRIGNHTGTVADIDVVGGTTLQLQIAGNTELTVTSAGLNVPANSDLNFTGTTGTNDIVLTNALADALSITDGSADIVVIDTSTSGNVITLTSALTVGSDGSGSDVIFYSGTSGDNLTWDASEELLTITGTDGQTALNVADGNVTIADNLTVSGNLTVTGTTTSVDSTTINAATAFVFEGATADAHETTFGIVDPTADATINLPAMGAGTYYLPVLAAATTTTITSTPAELNLLDGLDRGSILYGNSSSATTVLGQGSADTVLTSDGTDISWAAPAGGSTLTVTDNESTNENNLITFVANAATSTGTHGLEMDGNLYYNPSSGLVTATGFSGTLTGTLQTASQTNITAVGTITGGTWTGTTIAVANGGTGATSLTDKAVLISQDSGTDTLGSVALTTSGQIIIGGSSGPAAATISAGTNVTITNGDGSISIAASGGGVPNAFFFA